MEKRCKNCKHYSDGITEEQRHKWDWSNFGRHATGVCNLHFPRGYVAQKPPHPAMAANHCFQWEEARLMDTVCEPGIGECVKSTGAVIPHIMRPAYIGKKVLYDISTQSMRCYQCGVLEKYIPYEGKMRSVIFYGKKQRALVTHYAGVDIYECLPWDAYQERAKAWKQSTFTPVQLSLF